VVVAAAGEGTAEGEAPDEVAGREEGCGGRAGAESGSRGGGGLSNSLPWGLPEGAPPLERAVERASGGIAKRTRSGRDFPPFGGAAADTSSPVSGSFAQTAVLPSPPPPSSPSISPAPPSLASSAAVAAGVLSGGTPLPAKPGKMRPPLHCNTPKEGRRPVRAAVLRPSSGDGGAASPGDDGRAGGEEA